MSMTRWQLYVLVFVATIANVFAFQLRNDVDDLYTAEIEYLNGALEQLTFMKPAIPGQGPAVKSKRSTAIIERPGNSVETHDCGSISSVPDDLRLPANMFPSGLGDFYQKYTHAYGIPILGSANVSDSALKRACYMVRFLLADRPDLRETFYKMFGRFALMSTVEMTTDIPEHSHMDKDFWDARARGLGATRDRPLSTGGEENTLCLKQDRYPKEDIPLHEFAHGVHLIAAKYAIEGFEDRLTASYLSAKLKGLWNNTYAMTNLMEYWAEAVQSYFNDDDISISGNGIHNHIHTRKGLKNYDPDIFALCQEIWPCDNTFLHRCLSSRGLEQEQQLKMNCNGTNNPIFSYSAECADTNFHCPSWAGMGGCVRNPRYMLPYCPRSCRVCTTNYEGKANQNNQSRVVQMSTCDDIASECAWQMCGKDVGYSAENCRSTCVNCDYYLDLFNRTDPWLVESATTATLSFSLPSTGNSNVISALLMVVQCLFMSKFVL
ncbi:uncharacterized protein LOC135482814 [Lineus longissimus]|uniref:uncharacterized protein LOC135482814 n=1 Tax=Lineus longissimus TaxID=88925 RepID=UPI00315C786D